MVRATTAYILTAVVLVAPYVCSQGAAGQRAERSTVPACSCCRLPVADEGLPPRSPDDIEPDCLCRGAIIESASDISPHNGGDSVCNFPGDASLPTTGVLQRSGISVLRRGSFPYLTCGRDLCA